MTGRRAKLQNIQTTATIYGQYVGGFLEVARMASGIDDNQHTPMAAAVHTTRYDLQAGMAAGAIRTATRRRAWRPGGGAAYFSTLKAKKNCFSHSANQLKSQNPKFY